ncbi:MAG: MATE family efflux transporter [Eubacteriales bacterium]
MIPIRLNLTEGPPLRLLLKFSLPMLIGSIFQQLYTMVDSIIVGQYEGTQALAAVGSSYPITLLAVAMAQGLSMGANVVIGQLFGAKRLDETKTTITTALIGMTILGLLLGIIGEIFSEAILQLLGTDSTVFVDACDYLKIYFIGCTFVYLFNTLNGIFSALGDTKTPTIALALSTVLNIGLDLLFVIHYGWGVVGVAWATTIANGFSALYTMIVLLKKLPEMGTKQKPPLFTKQAALRIAKLGLPSMFQQSFMALSITTVQGLVNSYGDLYVAGYTAGTKFDNLAVSANVVFSSASATFTAQNIGAQKPERVKDGYRCLLILTTVYSVVIATIIYIFTPELLSLFLTEGESNPAMIYGVEYIRVVSVFYPLMGCFFVTGGLLRGCGKISQFISSSMTNMILRVVFAYTLTTQLAELSIAVAIPLGWMVGMCISAFHFSRIKWNTLQAEK